MYRVHWRSKATGAEGCGDPMLKELAEAWLKHAATAWPELLHWIAPA